VSTREDIIHGIETAGGSRTCSRLHLCPAVIGLGNAGTMTCERDVYDDMRDKPDWGSL